MNPKLKGAFQRLLLAVFSFLFALAGLELALRLVGAGYPTALWVASAQAGRPIWRDNEFFTYRFVAPPMARIPSIAQTDRAKPAGAVRVVVLGESAALGDPMADFGPPRMLEKMLRQRYPGQAIEVINGAITAINSHVIREIARELPTLQPDVVILYVGNNEVIGPYGPGTVFSGFFDSDAFVRTMVLASRLRLTQVARFAVTAALEGRVRTDFQGLSMFTNRPVARDDPRLDAVYRRFERNLRKMLASARDAGAETLLCTVAVNRRDSPPTISLHRPGLGPDDAADWERAYRQGREALAAEQWDQALAAFRAAAAKDDAHAELAWLTGLCLDQTGQREQADAAFRAACELDAFRCRADARLNDAVRRLAAGAPGTAFVDADRIFATNAPLGDADLFVDHVHFSPAGTHLLAAAWAAALADMAPFRGREPRPLPVLAQAEDLLLYTPYFELEFTRRVAMRLSRPPFSAQFGSSNRVARCLRRNAELEQTVQEMDLAATRAQVEARMRTDPLDPFYPLHWGECLLGANRWREGERALLAAAVLAPHRMNVRLQLARARAVAKRPEEAAAAILDGRRKHGYFAAEETFTVVSMLLGNGQANEALAFAEAVDRRIRALDYRWRIARAVAQLRQIVRLRDEALALMDRGNAPEALRTWHALLNLRQDPPDPFFWTGAYHRLRGAPQEAEPFLTQAWRRWSFARGAYHRGILLAKTGQTEAARVQLAKAADQAGDDEDLARSLAWTFRSHPDPALRDSERLESLLAAAEAAGRNPAADWIEQVRPFGWALLAERSLP